MNASRRPAAAVRRRVLTGLGCPSADQLRERSIDLPPGDAGTSKTVHYMNLLAAGKEGARNAQVRQAALDIVRQVASRDSAGEIHAVYNFVKKNIQFRGEYNETLQSPLVTLRLGAGDCDDHSMLTAALLMNLGYQVRFRTVAADASAPREFSHVFAEVLDKKSGQWTGLDTTVAQAYPGWTPPNVTRSHAWRALGGLSDAAPAQPPTLTQQIVGDINMLIPAIANRITYGQQPVPLYNQVFGAPNPYGPQQPSWLSGSTVLPVVGLVPNMAIAGVGVLGLLLALAKGHK